MNEGQFQDLLTAIKRGSMLALDNVLPIEGMTMHQLRTLYDEIGKDYTRRALTKLLGLELTVGDALAKYDPGPHSDLESWRGCVPVGDEK